VNGDFAGGARSFGGKKDRIGRAMREERILPAVYAGVYIAKCDVEIDVVLSEKRASDLVGRSADGVKAPDRGGCGIKRKELKRVGAYNDEGVFEGKLPSDAAVEI
jgi:hypothetical protein